MRCRIPSFGSISIGTPKRVAASLSWFRLIFFLDCLFVPPCVAHTDEPITGARPHCSPRLFAAQQRSSSQSLRSMCGLRAIFAPTLLTLYHRLIYGVNYVPGGSQGQPSAVPATLRLLSRSTALTLGLYGCWTMATPVARPLTIPRR